MYQLILLVVVDTKITMQKRIPISGIAPIFVFENSFSNHPHILSMFGRTIVTVGFFGNFTHFQENVVVVLS